MSLLVDPLAALFRPALLGCEPLVLDTTHVEVSLLPPLAHIVVVRTFKNGSDQLVEAVLTLPPIAPQEVVYRLIVNIGGVEYQGVPQPRTKARRAHDAAVADGRRAILYELLKNNVQLISIAGIEPGMRVEVQIWSIRPLARPSKERATLSIPLSIGAEAAMAGLADSDAPISVATRHDATLSVTAAEGFQVSVGDPAGRFTPIISGARTYIDCAAPVILDVVSENGSDFDHCAWQVDKAGGWEVTSAHGIETFRHPMNPDGDVVSDRSDWIFGIIETADGAIRVTAPLPTEGIAPNARALRAFAAAGLAESAMLHEVDFVRRTANILSRQTSLAFIGPAGVLSDAFPVLRKLALPDAAALNDGFESISFTFEPPPEMDEVDLTEKTFSPLPSNPPLTPGARPPAYAWLSWVSAGLFILWVLGALRYLPVPLGPVMAAFVILMLLNAVRFFPRGNPSIRRRLPILALLTLPWIVSILFGPMGLVEVSWHQAQREGMVQFQGWLLAASAILPLLLLPVMRGGRGFTTVVGILNFVATYFATSIAIITNMPGS